MSYRNDSQPNFPKQWVTVAIENAGIDLNNVTSAKLVYFTDNRYIVPAMILYVNGNLVHSLLFNEFGGLLSSHYPV